MSDWFRIYNFACNKFVLYGYNLFIILIFDNDTSRPDYISWRHDKSFVAEQSIIATETRVFYFNTRSFQKTLIMLSLSEGEFSEKSVKLVFSGKIEQVCLFLREFTLAWETQLVDELTL